MGVIIEANAPLSTEYHPQLDIAQGPTCPASSTQYNRTSQHESIRHLSNSRLPLTNLPARETVRTSRNCNPARVAFTLPTREPVAMGNRSNGSFPLCSQSHHLNMPGTVYQWEGRATSGVTGAGLAGRDAIRNKLQKSEMGRRFPATQFKRRFLQTVLLGLDEGDGCSQDCLSGWLWQEKGS